MFRLIRWLLSPIFWIFRLLFGWIPRLFGFGDSSPHATLPPVEVKNKRSIKQMSEHVDWGLKALGIPDIWAQTQGENVKIAVLDTGVATKHPDLKDRIVATKDFTGDGIEDVNGHGSHCAGIIAASRDGEGVVGVAPKAELMIGKVLSNSGSGRYSWIIKGMQWALDEGADIISMSLGGPVGTDELEEMVKKVIASDTILIVAAGNEGEGENTIGYPGGYDDVICVGSIKRGQKRSSFSSTGPNITIMAPGEDIYSCYPPDGYASLSGTSMATPFIAGVAALILSKHRGKGGHTPCENQTEMFEHLKKVAVDIEDPGWDKNSGWGIVSPDRSIDDVHKVSDDSPRRVSRRVARRRGRS